MRRRPLVLGLVAPWLLGSETARADDGTALRRAMQEALRLRDAAVAAGDQPYGAVVLRGDRILGAAPSRVVLRGDADAHAEREALRDALQRLGATELAGSVLVSSSRPCALCEAAARRVGIVRMVHGANLAEVEAPRAPVAVAQSAPPSHPSSTTTMNLLHEAARRGDVPALRRLLDAGAPVDARDAQRRTALLVATHADQAEAARLLIERGADVNAQDAIQDSPFLYAGAEGRLAILRLCLAAGADLASTNRYGGTALIPAAHHGHVEVVRELLTKTRIAVDHVNRLGWTALLEAVILGDGGAAHTEIVRLLLAHGADPNLPDREGITPLAHAERARQAGVIALLRGAGARARR